MLTTDTARHTTTYPPFAARTFLYSARERGTQNLLCDSFGCEQPNLQSLQRRLANDSPDIAKEDKPSGEDYLRMLEEGKRGLGTGIMSMPSGPSCPYVVVVTIDALIPTGPFFINTMLI